MIKLWIDPNKSIKFELIYRATRDGFTSEAFHYHCNEKGPTLTLIKANTG